MILKRFGAASVASLFCAGGLLATDLLGVIHDPQHRPIPNAAVLLGVRTVYTDAGGGFHIDTPEGIYTLKVMADGFKVLVQDLTVERDRNPVLHLQLEVAGMQQRVEVSDELSQLHAEDSTVKTLVSAQEIEETPGAALTNSLAMITDFTPGAYMVHDMLHMRGGHQVNWFFDDIPIVNTNIAANVAPLINPKNVAGLEVERGGYSSEYGDRTYGFFNVETPSGFERNNEAQIIASAGNLYTTDDQLNVGGHTQKFAYYASVDGNRSNLGLMTPTSALLHDETAGVGGFLSLLYNPTGKDQIRLVTSLREDHYQIPNDVGAQAAGIRDIQSERNDLVGFHWAHTLGEGVLFTLTPYFQYNQADFNGGPQDTPFILRDLVHSSYFGGRAVLRIQKKRHNLRFGTDVWGEHNNAFFGLSANPGSMILAQTQQHGANSDSLFIEDEYRVASWLTLNAGLRLQHYGGLLSENAADPRIGGAIQIPKLGWTIHGYYAYYYQPPPLDSLSGPSLGFALQQGYGFVALPGERDIQHDVGLTIPFHAWSLDVDSFHTSARNFLDHDVVGDAGIFIPLTDLGATISGTEVAVRSPKLFGRVQVRVAYSNQIAEGIAPVTGGLLEFAGTGAFLLDHDQRNTLSSVFSLRLPWDVWATPTYQFGSGFLDGNGPGHLPVHSTADLALGKQFRENWSLGFHAVNLANSRYLLDDSNTFGGTHFVNPRQLYAEIRYRFHL